MKKNKITAFGNVCGPFTHGTNGRYEATQNEAGEHADGNYWTQHLDWYTNYSGETFQHVSEFGIYEGLDEQVTYAGC